MNFVNLVGMCQFQVLYNFFICIIATTLCNFSIVAEGAINWLFVLKTPLKPAVTTVYVHKSYVQFYVRTKIMHEHKKIRCINSLLVRCGAGKTWTPAFYRNACVICENLACFELDRHFFPKSALGKFHTAQRTGCFLQALDRWLFRGRKLHW